MKLANAVNREFENNLGNVQTAQFSISANGKAFRGLIDGLYSDKHQSITRELWSNAFDAHLAAGCADKPFYVEVPSRLSPVFLVRDYGIGMDHETVMGVYTSMFSSTKDGSNDMVGAFGLGSKTPFAYTDTFTITAFDGTERRTYLAFLDGGGVPNLSLMLTEPSAEPRGVEVTFPVQPNDVNAFQAAATKVVEGFDVPPIGNNVPTPKAEDWLLTGNGWKLSKVRYEQDSVRQGCAVYPIPTQRRMHDLQCRIALDVPIGSVEVTLSRESLSMTPETTKVIQAAFVRAATEAKLQIEAQVKAAGDDYEQAMLAYKFRETGLVPQGRTTVPLPQPKVQQTSQGLQIADDWPLTTLKNELIRSREVSTLENLVIYVDKGEKVPRRRLRMRNLGYYGERRGPNVLFDVSKTDISLAQVIKIWHLEPTQIKSITEIPDVQVAARVKQPPKPKVLPAGSFWATYEPNSRTYINVKGRQYTVQAAQAIMANLGVPHVGGKLIPFTVLQSAKMDPKTSLETFIDTILKRGTDLNIERAVAHRHLTGYKTLDAKIGTTKEDAILLHAVETFDTTRYVKIRDSVATRISKLMAEYPMLNPYSATEADRYAYVAAIDFYREAKANGRI